MNVKKKKVPTTRLNSSRCMFDICLTAVPRSIGWEACENIPHVLIVSSLPVSLSHSLCRSVNVSESSLLRPPQKPCFSLSLLWATNRGLTQGREMYVRKRNGKLNIQRDSLIHTAQTQEKLCSFVSASKSLHFISVIEPPVYLPLEQD